MEHIFRIIALPAAVVLFAISQVPTPAPAQESRTAGHLEINLPEVVEEVKAAHDRYNDAINAGDIAVTNSTFYKDDRTIRLGQADMEYSYKEIE